MNIGSAIVCALPNQAGAVRARLAGLPGVEVHGETGDGRFVVTVEDLPGAAVSDTVMQLHRLEGVLFAAMVYQYSDDGVPGEEAQP
jgi:periplasmic nitrate reductase NapD